MVELIPKKPEKEIPLKNVSLFAAGALLLAVILSYVVLIKTEAEAISKIQDFEDEIARVGAKEDREIEGKVFDYEKKIKNLAFLVADRRRPSQFFENFENLVHPLAWFSSFELDVVQMQAAVSGHTANFETLEQQLIFLQNKKDFIEIVGLSDIAVGEEGGAEFGLNFIFKPEIFEIMK